MKVYYWNSRTDESVPSAEPVDFNLLQTLRVFNTLNNESFLGIELTSTQFLQMRNVEGAWWTEIMDSNTSSGLGCTISQPMAEQTLTALFQGANAKTWLSDHFPWLQWEVIQVS